MRRALATVLLLSSLLSTVASAQTLTVEIDGVLEVAPAPRGQGQAVVVVRPLEDEPFTEDSRTRVAPPEPPRPMVVSTQAPAPSAAHDDADIEGFGGIGLVVEGFDLTSADLALGRTEIEALSGLRLSPGWAGNEPLRDAIVGGAMLSFGMRASGILRGPELRLHIGGGDIEGAYLPVDGGPAGMELAVRSIFMVRAELALGLQVELGPVIPYVQATGSLGGAWIDVSARDPNLGGLGTETIEAALFGLGIEAGLDIEVDEGTSVGFAFRANFLGAPSLGGALRVLFGGE